MKKLLVTLFAAFLVESSAWATNACVAETNQSLEELLKVVKELNGKDKELSKRFCWAQAVCNMSEDYNEETDEETYNFKNRTMPKDFSCDESEFITTSLHKFRCGMTAEEEEALADYTGSGYGCMNAYLRQKKQKNADVQFFIDTLNKALDKLPNYEGLVIRGADLPPKIAAQHAKGKIVTYEAFTSTSTTDLEWGKDRFAIISKTGKPIMGLSDIEEEYEVLFKAGTKFKVLDVVKNEEGNLYIMKEITCGPGTPQEKKEDEELIKKLKEGKIELDDTWKPDSWACPEDEKGSIPIKIKQKSIPAVNLYHLYEEED